MKLDQVLRLLKEHGVFVELDKTDENQIRMITVGCALPRMPYGDGRFAYATLVFEPGEDEVSVEERDALKRRLHHLTTDIFGDDPDHWEVPAEDEETPDSHLQSIIAKAE